jgi:hypothetical protein
MNLLLLVNDECAVASLTTATRHMAYPPPFTSSIPPDQIFKFIRHSLL